jgi:hypothetical protein
MSPVHHDIMIRWSNNMNINDDPNRSCRAVDIIDPNVKSDFSCFFDLSRVNLTFSHLYGCKISMTAPVLVFTLPIDNDRDLKVRDDLDPPVYQMLQQTEAWYRHELVPLGFTLEYVDQMIQEIARCFFLGVRQMWVKARMLYNGALKTLLEFRTQQELQICYK